MRRAEAETLSWLDVAWQWFEKQVNLALTVLYVTEVYHTKSKSTHGLLKTRRHHEFRQS